MEKQNTTIGLLGVLGVWLTAGIALPLVNVLSALSTEQLMTCRGLITAVIALVMARGLVWKTDTATYILAITTPLATWGLFQGVREWGVGPTVIILTATPVLNIFIGLTRGRVVARAMWTGLVLILAGVIVAYAGTIDFSWRGLGWSILATVANSLVYECLDRSNGTQQQKTFWMFLGMGVFGVSLSAHISWTPFGNTVTVLQVIGWALIGGFLYGLANIAAFRYLHTNEASVLVQGETPAVMLGAYLLLGEQLTTIQWIGVLIALYGAYYLSRRTTTKEAAS